MKKILLVCLILSFALFIFGCEKKTSSTSGGLTGSVTGKALLEGKSDHSGIVVSVYATSFISTTTASDGSYSISDVPKGEQTFNFTKGGYGGQSKTVTVTGGTNTNIDTVTLSSSYGGLTGTAKLEGQTDHSGISVSISANGYTATATTNSSGEFSSTNLPPGTVTINFSKSGFDSVTTTNIISAWATTNVSVTLNISKGGITGTATLSGSATAGITVTLNGTSTQTDSSGSFLFSNLSPGNYTLTYGYSGYVSRFQQVTVSAAATADAGTVDLTYGKGSITGIIDLDGETDDSGTTVSVNQTLLSGTTAADGSFTISEVPTGTYSLTMSISGFVVAATSNIFVEEGEVTNIGTITITSRITVSGVIKFDGPGSPGVEGITVVLNSSTPVTATTDETGEYSFSNVLIGSHTITPTKNGWAFEPSSYTVSSNASDKDFEASINGWTNISNSNITHDLYDYTYDENGDTHILVGAGGKAYISASLQNIDQGQLTNSQITGESIYIRCPIFHLSTEGEGTPSWDVDICSQRRNWHWYPNRPSGNDPPSAAGDGDNNFSSFTTSAEDITIYYVGDDGPHAMIVCNGGIYRNTDFYSNNGWGNAALFETTNRAPTGMNVRSIDGGCMDEATNQYVLFIGGDNGKLYFYDGTGPPGSSDWTEINSGTTEKITGIYMKGQPVVFITENGSLGYLQRGSPRVIAFTGLPYTLNGVYVPGDGYSGTIIVGSNGLMLRKD